MLYTRRRFRFCFNARIEEQQQMKLNEVFEDKKRRLQWIILQQAEQLAELRNEGEKFKSNNEEEDNSEESIDANNIQIETLAAS